MKWWPPSLSLAIIRSAAQYDPLKKDLDKVDPGLLSQAKELIKGVRESLKRAFQWSFCHYRGGV